MGDQITPGRRFAAFIVLLMCVAGWCMLGSGIAAANEPPDPGYTDYDEPVGGPNYPVSPSREVRYWVLNCEQYVRLETIQESDRVLEILRADHIAETMFLCMPAEEITWGAQYSIQFGKYMRLGLPEGPRANNGMVFLFIIGDGTLAIDAGVGEGASMSPLTGIRIGDLKRQVELEYAQTKDLDAAMLRIANDFDTEARSLLLPYEPEPPNLLPPGENAGNEETSSSDMFTCLGIFLFMVLLWYSPTSILTLIGVYLGWQLMLLPIDVMSRMRLSGGYGGIGRTGGGTIGGGTTTRGGRTGGGGGGMSRGN